MTKPLPRALVRSHRTAFFGMLLQTISRRLVTRRTQLKRRLRRGRRGFTVSRELNSAGRLVRYLVLGRGPRELVGGAVGAIWGEKGAHAVFDTLHHLDIAEQHTKQVIRENGGTPPAALGPGAWPQEIVTMENMLWQWIYGQDAAASQGFMPHDGER